MFSDGLKCYVLEEVCGVIPTKGKLVGGLRTSFDTFLKRYLRLLLVQNGRNVGKWVDFKEY